MHENSQALKLIRIMIIEVKSIDLKNMSIERLNKHLPTASIVIILAITVLGPLLGEQYAKYLLIFYIGIFIFVLSKPMPNPTKYPLLYGYIIANAVSIIFHFDQSSSILNAGSLVISIIAISGLSYYLVRRYGISAIDLSLEYSLWISLSISICLSIILTAMKWPGAPVDFPWEAIYSKSRFLLIEGEGVGHTVSLWVIAFLCALTLHRLVSTKIHNKLKFRLILLALVLLLVETKSRLAIVYIIYLVIMWLAYKRLPLMHLMVLIFPIIYVISILALSLVPAASTVIDNSATEVQNIVGNWIRITPSDKSGLSAFAGRDILNQSLLQASLEQPFRGLGDDADILIYGIDGSGNVAYDSRQEIAKTESVLRLAVKYGWIYFSILILFLLSIPSSFKFLERQQQILKLGLWGICIESMASTGAMEIFYDKSGLFLFILCIIKFQSAHWKNVYYSFNIRDIGNLYLSKRQL